MSSKTPSRLFPVKKAVRVWLFIGLVMVFFQIVIGGITRLTGSGLSITKWDIVLGTIPPLTGQAWQEAFDLYKESPQYHQINKGMSLGDFKFIYFWEYFHRLWARMMGFVFLLPYIFFLRKKWIPKWLNKRLLIMIVLAMVVASFGWIMVASGLINRPWVNAYKLALHLSLGIGLIAYVAWTYFLCLPRHSYRNGQRNYAFYKYVLILIFIQIFLGGLVSGMKAGLLYPTFPDMGGHFIPPVLLQAESWQLVHFTDYDKFPFAPSLFHFCHRIMAYLIFILSVIFWFQLRQKPATSPHQNKMHFVYGAILMGQVLLGIITVIQCKGGIPVLWGVMHQFVAVILLLTVLYHRFMVKNRIGIENP